MSTNDVPGADPKHADVLRAGCWAEHDDGSLIYVKGTEQGRIVYEIYDMAVEPPVVYSDAMLEADFKRQFSYPPVGASKVKWMWHDKTPFPWDRVMKSEKVKRPRPNFASAKDHVTAAEQVARSLRLRAQAIHEENVRHRREETGARAARSIGERIGAAIDTLFG